MLESDIKQTNKLIALRKYLFILFLYFKSSMFPTCLKFVLRGTVPEKVEDDWKNDMIWQMEGILSQHNVLKETLLK